MCVPPAQLLPTAQLLPMAQALPAARVRARGWGWRHAGRRRWAVRELDLDIPAGQRVLLLGPSGAGKSTLLSALSGILHGAHSGQSTGELLIDGEPSQRNRRRSGLLMQNPDSQLVMARAGDDVAFGPENYGVERDQIWSQVDEALGMVGFGYGRNRATWQLSGGEKQRLALAGVLATRPGLLLLDEPTANLDPDGAAEVRAAVRTVLAATGSTFVLVEHRIEPWLDMIDRVVVLDASGGLLADGPVHRVFADHRSELDAAGIWWPGRRFAVDRPATSCSRRALIDAQQVRLTYHGSADAAVQPSDVTLRQGVITALVGRNGSGKSSLAAMLTGLVPPSGGTVRGADLPGRDLHRRRPASLARLVGTVFQNPEHQFLTSTVRAELELAPKRLHWSSSATTARVDVLLERLDLADLARANPFTLSGGQKRRLSVATALSVAAPALVLDEPTFGQDANTWLELARLFAELRNEGSALLVVSHDEQFVGLVADEVQTMAAGRVSESR